MLAGGNWGIAGIYLADWVTYEIRPTVEFRGDRLDVTYRRFSTYQADRQPGLGQTRACRYRARGQRARAWPSAP